jgi:hypothetical protein
MHVCTYRLLTVAPFYRSRRRQLKEYVDEFSSFSTGAENIRVLQYPTDKTLKV